MFVNKIPYICKIFILSIGLIYIQGCNSNNCNSKLKIDSIVLEAANNINIPYCNLVNNSLRGNPNDIKKLFCQHYFDGEASYLHSFYVYEISKELGESKIISIVKTFNQKDLMYYYSNLEFALQQENLGKNVEDEFPKLYIELWNNKNPINNKL